MTSGDLPPDFPLRETVNLDYAHGGSQIVARWAFPLVPPTSGDTILYAECQADMIKVWKAFDRWHYSSNSARLPQNVVFPTVGTRSISPPRGRDLIGPDDRILVREPNGSNAPGGNHSAGSGFVSKTAPSATESILHVDDNQGAAARVDGEKAFPVALGWKTWPAVHLSHRPEHTTSRVAEISFLILPGVRWLIPALPA